MSIEEIADTYLAAYCNPDAAARDELIRRVWNPAGRLVDPPLAASGHRGLGDQAATLLQLYPGHVFRRSTEVDRHHEFATFGWTLHDPAGAAMLEGRDFLTLDVDGRIMAVVGFFGPARPLTPAQA